MTISEMLGGLFGGAVGGAVQSQISKGAIDRVLNSQADNRQEELARNLQYLNEGQANLLDDKIKTYQDLAIGSDVYQSSLTGETPSRLPTKNLKEAFLGKEVYQKQQVAVSQQKSEELLGAMTVGVNTGRITPNEALQLIPGELQPKFIERLQNIQNLDKTRVESDKISSEGKEKRVQVEGDEWDRRATYYINRGEKLPDEVAYNMSPKMRSNVLEFAPDLLTKQQAIQATWDRATSVLNTQQDKTENNDFKSLQLSELASLALDQKKADFWADQIANHLGIQGVRTMDALVQQSLAKDELAGISDILKTRLTQLEYVDLSSAYPNMRQSPEARAAISAKMKFSVDYESAKTAAMDSIMDYHRNTNTTPPVNLNTAAEEMLRSNGVTDQLVTTFRRTLKEISVYNLKVPEGKVAVKYRTSSGVQTANIDLDVYIEAVRADPNGIMFLKSNLRGLPNDEESINRQAGQQ